MVQNKYYISEDNHFSKLYFVPRAKHMFQHNFETVYNITWISMFNILKQILLNKH